MHFEMHEMTHETASYTLQIRIFSNINSCSLKNTSSHYEAPFLDQPNALYYVVASEHLANNHSVFCLAISGSVIAASSDQHLW